MKSNDQTRVPWWLREGQSYVVSPSHKITSRTPGMAEHLVVTLLLLIQAMHRVGQCLATCVKWREGKVGDHLVPAPLQCISLTG